MANLIHIDIVTRVKRGLLFLFLLCFSSSVLAADETVEKSKKFDAGELIIEHVGDSHEWHLVGDIALPLPIIIYSSSKGLDIFMSGRLENHESYKGYKLNSKNKIEAEDGSSFIDLSITKNVASLLFSVALMIWTFLSVAKAYGRREGEAPKGMQSLIEPLIVFVRDDIAKGSIGPNYAKYMPYLLTVFFFIWINNMLGLIPIIPGGANVTGNIAVTMTLALITFVVTSISANRNYWQHVFAMPGVPKWVLFILTPIEILGVFLRPFVLMIRLFANITAGHIIALSFFSLIFIFGELSTAVGYGVSVVSVAFVVFMSLLELLVAFLQAYVFTLLSAIYFGAALEEHTEHHAAEEDHIAQHSLV